MSCCSVDHADTICQGSIYLSAASATRKFRSWNADLIWCDLTWSGLSDVWCVTTGRWGLALLPLGCGGVFLSSSGWPGSWGGQVGGSSSTTRSAAGGAWRSDKGGSGTIEQKHGIVNESFFSCWVSLFFFFVFFVMYVPILLLFDFLVRFFTMFAPIYLQEREDRLSGRVVT